MALLKLLEKKIEKRRFVNKYVNFITNIKKLSCLKGKNKIKIK